MCLFISRIFRIIGSGKIFDKYGKVRDIFISNKKNKGGKRFGFVRFLDVVNAVQLEKRLETICIGDVNMEINLPKFEKDKYLYKRSISGGNSDLKHQSYQRMRGEASYANVCNKNQPHSTPQREKQNKESWKDEEWYGLEYNVEQEEMEWLKKCYVAEVKRPNVVLFLQERLCMQGYQSVKVTPMGGSLVMLYPDDEGEILDMISKGSPWMNELFVSVRPWSPKEVSVDRTVWLRCIGVPIHTWNAGFFSFLTGGMGKFISLDDSTSTKVRFDVARVLVQTIIPKSIDRLIEV